jgi:NADPH-dependent glutamate synthase beta subunit-like oxidoreductase/coenzyme F420-reducing hydrogenase delta subunit/ferredoxin
MFDRDLTSKDLAGIGDVRTLMGHEWAPCRFHCPVHADVREYIELIARGQYAAAVDVIRENLPFACVCGRICHHPCENNCRRQDVDQAVAIRELKRFVAERVGAVGAAVARPAVQDKARVAIVGGGPAGLSAALDLAKLGYRPTVLERFPVAGGVPATAVPKYRLPREVLNEDVSWIIAHGVDLRTNVAVGVDKKIPDLLAEGFRAVVIATGLAHSRMLDLPGLAGPRVYGTMEFLNAASFHRPLDTGENVVVIGGGNVAMDAARTALRQGALRVTAMCLENPQEMPAWPWELREAEEEGVGFLHRRGPTEIVRRDGAVVAVKARNVTAVFDAAGKFAPRYDDTDVVDVECDTVVLAIGQQADMGFLAGSDLATDARGRLAYNPATQQTSRPNVFACGEIVTMPGSVVEACAHGRRAAKAVDLFLRGAAIELNDATPPAIGKIAAATAGKVKKETRVEIVATPAQQRRSTQVEIDRTMAEAEALRESRRCMSCGAGAEVLVDRCAACLTCKRVCPFDIPVVTDVARIDSALCQACGMCIADCPAHAIVARGWDVGELKARTADAVKRLTAPGRKLVAFICGHHSPANAWAGSREDAVPNVAELYLPSVSRLSVEEILHALEAGADGVVVIACQLGADRYPGATQRVRKRVAEAQTLLKEIGLGAERVTLSEVAAEGRAAIRAALEAAAKVAG